MVRSSRRRVHLAPGREALVRCCLDSNLGLHAIRLMTTSAVDHDKTGVVEFFNCPRWCLRFAKDNRWIVADGKTYILNPDGCWRTPPIRGEIGAPPVWKRHQFEHVLASRTERIEKLEAANRRLTGSRKAIAAGEAAGPAISALVEIMSDPTISIPKRLQAAEGLLAYKTPQDVAESAKLFLASIFTDPEQNIDHRLAATTALRRSEDVRIMPAIERPPARTDVDPAEKPIPLRELVAQRRARADRMERELIEATNRERLLTLKPGRNGSGNGSDSGSE
jgi:hypothetical protein